MQKEKLNPKTTKQFFAIYNQLAKQGHLPSDYKEYLTQNTKTNSLRTLGEHIVKQITEHLKTLTNKQLQHKRRTLLSKIWQLSEINPQGNWTQNNKLNIPKIQTFIKKQTKKKLNNLNDQELTTLIKAIEQLKKYYSK